MEKRVEVTPQSGLSPDVAGATGQVTTLQHVLFPDPLIETDPSLYLRLSQDAVLESAGDGAPAAVHLAPGAEIDFDTYFNAFDAGEWAEACGLNSLEFRLRGSGRVTLRLLLTCPENDPEQAVGEGPGPTIAHQVTTLHEDSVTLDPDRDVVADIPTMAEHAEPGVIHVEIVAESEARIASGRFVTRDVPRRAPRLAISITTFRREAEVEQTARRLEAFLAEYEFADRVFVQVVDNGATATIPESTRIRYFTNANLGGAGGFSRGLIEAKKAGATHCLFMDDDAAFHMENIRRTYALLAFASDPAAAVAGAMITNTDNYRMLENGALFNGVCHSLHHGRDLRDRRSVFEMLFRATRTLPPTAYGGWWYFAFPIAHVRYFPWPFFVRGDDSGFALANQFHIRTLNGVVSFQDSFGEKDSPLVSYLDTRYHLLHHIVFDELVRTPWRTIKVPLRLILRSMVRFHYETVEAQLLAVKDVMRGPDFFLENADMAARRKKIGAMTQVEVKRPIEAEPTRLRTSRRITDGLWALTINGHFLPGFGLFGRDQVLPWTMRGPRWPIWGARSITYIDEDNGTGYTVRHSKARGLGLLRETWRTARSFTRSYDAIRADYRARYGEIASEEGWNKLLGLEPEKAGPAAAED